MRIFRILLLGLSVLLVATSCGRSDDVPSNHESIDAFNLQLDNASPKAGERIQLKYPDADTELYTSGFVFDLEKKKSSGDWVLVAKLTTPFAQSPGREPGIISASDKNTLLPAIGRPATGSVPLILPKDAQGSYRIVDVITKSDEPSSRMTIAVAFDITK